MNRKLLWLTVFFLLAACASQPTVSPALRDEMAPSGTLVAAINYGNPVIAQRDPAGGKGLRIAVGSGFVAESLRTSGITDATVAPAGK